MVPVPVSCRIPEILKSIGQNQTWLVAESGLPKQRISDYVTMRKLMSLPTAYLIANVLHVRSDDLYNWEWRRE